MDPVRRDRLLPPGGGRAVPGLSEPGTVPPLHRPVHRRSSTGTNRDQKRPWRFARASSCTSKTVSRVLYLTAIYLGAPLPVRSSHLPGAAGPACMLPSTVLLRIEFTAIGQFPADRVSSYLAFPPLPRRRKLRIPPPSRPPSHSGKNPAKRFFSEEEEQREACRHVWSLRRRGGISLLHFS